MNFFYKIWRTYSWVYPGITRVAFPTKPACVIPLRETFYFNDVLQNWNRNYYFFKLLVYWRKLDHSIYCCSQLMASPLLCLCQGSQWTFRAHFCVLFMVHCVICVKLMLRIFEFGVWLFDYPVYRQNVTCLKRFTRYGHYMGEMEDNYKQTCCPLNCCAKIKNV